MHPNDCGNYICSNVIKRTFYSLILIFFDELTNSITFHFSNLVSGCKFCYLPTQYYFNRTLLYHILDIWHSILCNLITSHRQEVIRSDYALNHVPYKRNTSQIAYIEILRTKGGIFGVAREYKTSCAASTT